MFVHFTENAGSVKSFSTREPYFAADVRGNHAVQQSFFQRPRDRLGALGPGRPGRRGDRRHRGRLDRAPCRRSRHGSSACSA